MKKKPSFSVIIPHKNIPCLLQRCLDSIPRRDDLQIIVVDDNSDSSKVDFERFPGIDDDHIEVYFTKEGKGAGYARNIGMSHAKGEWLIFADSDDFFVDNIGEILDKYVDSQEDIVYFNSMSVMSDDVTIMSGRDSRNDLFYRYENCHDESAFRCDCPQPWGRMTRRSFVEAIGARFDETRYSNDFFFDIYTGVKAKTIKPVNIIMYVVTEREGSLANKFCETMDEWYIRYDVAWKVKKIVDISPYSITQGSVDFFWKILTNKNPRKKLQVLLHYWYSLRKLCTIFVSIIRNL